jgi:phenylalanine-4-hydroxylase
LKANPYSKKAEIKLAEKKIKALNAKSGMPSEMTLIRNLHWWTVEYGLVGSLIKPKIYGAGLLSSIGESVNALKYDVKKILYSLDAMDYGFDITKPQPQLFVTPDFKHLTTILQMFTKQMAFTTGGLDGIMKAIESNNTATIEYSSGLQVSGTFTDVLISEGRPVYINTIGPTTLNYQNKMIAGEGKERHADGFGSPVGKIKGTLKPTRFLSDADLAEYGIIKGKHCQFEFESGVKVDGVMSRVVRKDDKILLITFYDCTVRHNRKILFDPSWGHYDMAVGESIASAFSGPADADAFELSKPVPKEKTLKINYDEKTIKLHKLYKKIKEFVNGKQSGQDYPDKLFAEYKRLKINDWLFLTELLAASRLNKHNSKLEKEIIDELKANMLSNPSLKNLIDFGIEN